MTTATSTSYQSTSSLLSPPPTWLSFASSSPRSGGILLNAYKSSAYPAPLTPPVSTSVLQHYPPRASTPNSNSNSSEEEKNGTGTPRKIRFAPLPDPRRAVAVCDDGQEFEMVEDEGTISFGGVKDSSPPRSIEEQLGSGSRAGSIASAEDDDEEFGKRKRRGSGTWGSATKSLLSPFLAKSPTKGGFLSPDTDDGEDYMGTKLTRRTSTGGLSGSNPTRFERETKRKEEFQGGFPIKYTFSAQSDAETQGRSSHKRAMSADRRRLLNGRIYGGGRNKQQKYEEPEFVEWGYGGMGSNKATTQSKWGSVQGKTVYTSGGKVGGGVEEDDDDGSGMAWVRRRRKERELKAQQEKERAQNGEEEKENVQQPVQQSQPTAPSKPPVSAHSSARTTPTVSTLSSAFSSRSQSPQPSLSGSAVNSGTATGTSTPHVNDEHHYKAVSLPPPPHHHHHHHHKHHGEKDHRPVPPPLVPVSSTDSVKHKGLEPGAPEANSLQLQLTPATPVSPDNEENKLQLQQAAVIQAVPDEEEEESDASDSESSDDDADVEDEDAGAAVEKKSVASSETDETESDAEDAADKARLTSAGAGVEKVSTKGRRG
ncbi:hypothetical protein CALVIDRAFT_564900 [Calocera viscosa TUFC12733]|uniref:Uncharacterized protein n=1 Tax=Calocera viscosa (strain TUFC12733) TaxID=1330018 RepID=A0A167KXH4_CALVF|nr:hypothetical protein CALVIDRAFT_564900 [Calocera viscosa TUFC12733]